MQFIKWIFTNRDKLWIIDNVFSFKSTSFKVPVGYLAEKDVSYMVVKFREVVKAGNLGI